MCVRNASLHLIIHFLVLSGFNMTLMIPLNFVSFHELLTSFLFEKRFIYSFIYFRGIGDGTQGLVHHTRQVVRPCILIFTYPWHTLWVLPMIWKHLTVLSS